MKNTIEIEGQKYRKVKKDKVLKVLKVVPIYGTKTDVLALYFVAPAGGMPELREVRPGDRVEVVKIWD